MTTPTREEARKAILGIDLAMRSRYKTLKNNVQAHLIPHIIVENGPEGGTYHLVVGGSKAETVTPIDATFQLAKSVAHIPLGTFSVLAPYLPSTVPQSHIDAKNMDPADLRMVAYEDPKPAEAWIPALEAWGTEVNATQRALPDADLQPELLQSSTNICQATLKFIRTAVSARTFTMKDFEDFTSTIFTNISTNMYWAARVQIDAVAALMARWREKLESMNYAWADVYVLVYSMWTTSELNQNTIIIRHFMEPDRVATHLLDIIAAQLPVPNPIEVAAENLARIVQDNIAAEMVFPTSAATAAALKGKEDLLSQQLLELLKQQGKSLTEPVAMVCPFGVQQGAAEILREKAAPPQMRAARLLALHGRLDEERLKLERRAAEAEAERNDLRRQLAEQVRRNEELLRERERVLEGGRRND